MEKEIIVTILDWNPGGRSGLHTTVAVTQRSITEAKTASIVDQRKAKPGELRIADCGLLIADCGADVVVPDARMML